MPDPKLVAWIQSCKQYNYTDDKIKQLLIDKGYKPENLEQYFKPESTFHQIASKGQVYKYIFYIYSGIFVLACSALAYWFMNNLIFMIIPLGFIGVFGYYLYKKDLPASIFTIATFYLLAVGLGQFPQTILIIGSGIVGFCTWYMYSKLMKINDILKLSWDLSIVLAMVLSIVTLAYEMLGFLESEFLAGYLQMFDFENMADPFIGGIVSLVLFNTPFIYFYLISKDKQISRIIWYTIPTGMFIVASLMIRFMAGYVVEMLSA